MLPLTDMPSLSVPPEGFSQEAHRVYGSARAELMETWHRVSLGTYAGRLKKDFGVSGSQGMHSRSTGHVSGRHDPQRSAPARCTGRSPEQGKRQWSRETGALARPLVVV